MSKQIEEQLRKVVYSASGEPTDRWVATILALIDQYAYEYAESDHEFNKDFCKDDVHSFFGLTYASYLAVPRSVLQSMPADWQHQFSALMDKMEDLYGGYDMSYTVHKRDKRGRFQSDPLQNYERGRRYIKPKPWGAELSSHTATKDGETV